MPSDAYVVQASSGEYSDRQTWTVAVYLDERLARQHADRAGVEARRRHTAEIWGEDGDYHPTFKALVAEANPFDRLPSSSTSDDRHAIYREGIDYSVDSVPIFAEVPA